MTNFSIEDKVTVITGGSGVLGSSIAKSFLKEGARVVIIGRSQQKIDSKLQVWRDEGMEAMGISADITIEEEVIRAKNLVIEKYGRVDVLINAAGGNIPEATQKPDQTIFDIPFEGIDKVLHLNLQGTIYPTMIFAKEMAEKKSGSIINISSVSTLSALSRVMGYSASKTAINNFTQYMACELTTKFGDKLRVNAIAPGFFIADQNRALLTNADGSFTERGQKIIDRTPMGRFGDLEELNGAAQFLSSDAASFVNGSLMIIDGGYHAYSGI